MPLPANPIALIVDEPSERRALRQLLGRLGLAVETFSPGGKLLEQVARREAVCCLLKAGMRGMSSMKFLAELAHRGSRTPVILLDDAPDLRTCVQAIKAGAFDYLVKPLRPAELRGTINQAIDEFRRRRKSAPAEAPVHFRQGRLTPRQQEVLGLVVAGLLNKEIAARLGISEKTIKVHRSFVMRKLGVRSVADLVRVAEKLKGDGAATGRR